MKTSNLKKNRRRVFYTPETGSICPTMGTALLPVAGLPGVLRWQPAPEEQRQAAAAEQEHAAAVQATVAAMMPRVFGPQEVTP